MGKETAIKMKRFAQMKRSLSFSCRRHGNDIYNSNRSTCSNSIYSTDCKIDIGCNNSGRIIIVVVVMSVIYCFKRSAPSWVQIMLITTTIMLLIVA